MPKPPLSPTASGIVSFPPASVRLSGAYTLSLTLSPTPAPSTDKRYKPLSVLRRTAAVLVPFSCAAYAADTTFDFITSSPLIIFISESCALSGRANKYSARAALLCPPNVNSIVKKEYSKNISPFILIFSSKFNLFHRTFRHFGTEKGFTANTVNPLP